MPIHKEAISMSNSIGKIRFSDGQILFFKYNGTYNAAINALYEDQDSAWGAESKNKDCKCSSGSEKVEIATDYGGGIRWTGFACRNCSLLTNGSTDPYRTEYAESDEDESGYYSPPIFCVFSPKHGLPDWW
jgi:hypothetical protein